MQKNRTIVWIICWLMCSTLVYSQPMSEDSTSLLTLVNRLRLFGERIPQEKVFVHMDNTCYFLGDTIWFSVYTRQTNTDKPSKISRVLYAELWNHDGYLVERKLVEMKEGRGHGCFALSDSLMYGGFYELRAYTRWQLNWGEYEHRHKHQAVWWFFNNTMAREYFRDYDKLYSRVFPVYDRPLAQGEYFHDMTLRPLIRQRTLKHKDELSLSLYPEGGNMITGIPCRIAFEAAMTDGEAVDGNLVITDNTGDTLAVAETVHLGRGVVELPPLEDIRYHATFNALRDDGNGKVLSTKVKLRSPDTDGVSIRVDKEGSAWRITSYGAGDVVQNLLGLSITCEGRLGFFQTLRISSEPSVIHVPDSLLQAGVNQLTIFDANGRIFADRLFFVTRPELMHAPLSITGLKEQYAPFEQVHLQVFAPSLTGKEDALSSSLSLSVRDAVHQDYTYETGNIMTEMLLASEIKGFVPQPDYFFEKDDEEHRRALDLLMMTQGWRRFNWQEMAIRGKFEIVHPAEQTPILTGSVHKYPSYLKEDPQLEMIYFNHFLWMGMDSDDARENVNWLFGKKSLTHGYRQYKGKEYKKTARMDSMPYLTKAVKKRMELDGEKLRREVRVHAEFVNLENTESLMGDVQTEKGRFTLNIPRFYGSCLLFLAASDTTKWNKRFLFWRRKPHQWIMPNEDEYPEFYVRLSFPYPRFPKPYTFYQTHSSDINYSNDINMSFMGIARSMQPVFVKQKKGRRLKRNFWKPVVVMDAYAAFNTLLDAGFIYGWYTGPDNLCSSFGRYLVSDMGGGLDYKTNFWLSGNRNLQPDIRKEAPNYSYLSYLDRIEAFCDYAPRLEEDKRYFDIEKPPVEIHAQSMPEGTERVTYRDRFMELHGFAYLEDFYHPDYQRHPPKEGQKDYRRTLYWNPDLQLDANGQAHITFYNNSQTTQICVEANGQAADGTLLYSGEQTNR